MKRRSFLAMLGLAPLVAAARTATAEAFADQAAPRLITAEDLKVSTIDVGSLRASALNEFTSIAIRDGQVSYEPYVDVDGLVPGVGEMVESDGIALRSVTHHFKDADGVDRIVWIR